MVYQLCVNICMFLRFCIQMCRINKGDSVSTILIQPISAKFKCRHSFRCNDSTSAWLSHCCCQGRGFHEGVPSAMEKYNDMSTDQEVLKDICTQELAGWVEIEHYMKICPRHIQYHITKSTLITPRGPDGAVQVVYKKGSELFSKNYDRMSRMIYMSCR